MRKIISHEVNCCDACDRQILYPIVCRHCEVEYCYDCSQALGHKFACGVHFSGFDDGYYCQNCIDLLTTDGTNVLFNAYVRIQEFRKEEEVIYRTIKAQQKEVELLIQKELEKI